MESANGANSLPVTTPSPLACTQRWELQPNNDKYIRKQDGRTERHRKIVSYFGLCFFDVFWYFSCSPYRFAEFGATHSVGVNVEIKTLS